MLDQLRNGDTVIVWKVDRLARSTRDLLETMETIREAGARFQSLSEPWANTTSHAGKLIMTVFAGSSALHAAEFSVAPSRKPSTCFSPWSSTPTAASTRCSPKCTPPMNSAAKGSLPSSRLISSANLRSVPYTNRHRRPYPNAGDQQARRSLPAQPADSWCPRGAVDDCTPWRSTQCLGRTAQTPPWHQCRGGRAGPQECASAVGLTQQRRRLSSSTMFPTHGPGVERKASTGESSI